MTDETSFAHDAPALPAATVFLDVASLADDEPESLARILGGLGTVCRPVRRIAYADWAALPDLRSVAHRHGFDQVQTTETERDGNAAALRLVVDAMEVALLEGAVDTVVLMTGSAALLPLVRSLRRHGRQVIGIGPARGLDPLFQAECDRFVDCVMLGRPQRAAAPMRPEIRPAPPPPVRTNIPLRPEPAPLLRPAEASQPGRLGPATAEAPRPAAQARAHRPSLTAQFDEPEAGPSSGPPLMAGSPVVPQRKGWFGKRR